MLCVAWGLGDLCEGSKARRARAEERRAVRRACLSDMFAFLRSRFRLLPLLVRSFKRLLLLLLLPSLIRFVRQAAS